MNSKELELMSRVARSDLENLQKKDIKDSLKDVAKKALKRPVSNNDTIFWPAGMLALGMSEAISNMSGQGSYPSVSDEECSLLAETLLSFTQRWKEQTGEKVSYVDDGLFGAALINAYKTTGDEIYHHGAIKIASFLSRSPKNIEESIIYNAKAGNDYIFADGAGQSAMFLASYGGTFHKAAASALAAKQLLNFYNHGIDSRSGLPYHAFSLNEAKKLGLLGWGRAMGWLLMGYSEYLINENNIAGHSLDNVSEKIRSQFMTLVKTTLSYQRLDGGFSWQLPAVDGEPDTSATAMIGYSLAKALNAGIFESDAENIKKALLSMRDFIWSHTKNGFVGQALSGCEDIAVHRQVYGHFPWGQGSALAMLCLTSR